MNRILLLAFLFYVAMTHAQVLTRYEESLIHVQNTLNTDERSAKLIMNTIDEFCSGLQANIEYVANADIPYSNKSKYINFIVDEYFESNLSRIDISSNTRNTIITRPITEYLYRLSRIKDVYGYEKVELLFETDFLGMGTFQKVDDDVYEIAVTMIQIFKAWYGDGRQYTDATRKKFRLNFYVDSENNLTKIRVNHILVAETYDLNQYNNKFK